MSDKPAIAFFTFEMPRVVPIKNWRNKYVHIPDPEDMPAIKGLTLFRRNGDFIVAQREHPRDAVSLATLVHGFEIWTLTAEREH